MSERLDFHIVPMDVARNPVARAVARQRMHAAVLDFLSRIYLLEDGEPVAADMSAAARVLAVAVRVLEQRARTTQDLESPAMRVMAGGMGAIAQCSARQWRWRTLDAVAVDRALCEALAVLRGADALETRQAWLHVDSLPAGGRA